MASFFGRDLSQAPYLSAKTKHLSGHSERILANPPLTVGQTERSIAEGASLTC